MPHIRFRYNFTVPKLLLNPETNYELNCKDSMLEIRLWNSDGSDLSAMPTADKIVQLEICRTVDVSEKRTGLLRELEAAILSADDCPKPDESGVYTAENPAGSKSIKFEELANPLQALFNEIGDSWYPLARQTLQLLRWRYRKWSQCGPTVQMSGRWENSDTHNWFRCLRYLPAPSDFLRIECGMSYHDSVKSFLESALAKNESEPIGHTLLQQAFQLPDARGAIVLAVSALEIAVKALIGQRVPHAEWLAFNLPTPSVEKIIQEYIGKLFLDVPEDEYKSIFSKEIMDELKKCVFLRNEIAHKAREADSHDAWKTCDCMRDIMFRLDFLAGNKWAKGYWKTPSEYGTNEGVKMTPQSKVTLRADIR
jgi:hypothetical protein